MVLFIIMCPTKKVVPVPMNNGLLTPVNDDNIKLLNVGGLMSHATLQQSLINPGNLILHPMMNRGHDFILLTHSRAPKFLKVGPSGFLCLRFFFLPSGASSFGGSMTKTRGFSAVMTGPSAIEWWESFTLTLPGRQTDDMEQWDMVRYDKVVHYFILIQSSTFSPHTRDKRHAIA